MLKCVNLLRTRNRRLCSLQQITRSCLSVRSRPVAYHPTTWRLYVHELESSSRKMLADATLLKNFISNAPVIKIPSSAHIKVDANELDLIMDRLEQKIEPVNAIIEPLLVHATTLDRIQAPLEPEREKVNAEIEALQKERRNQKFCCCLTSRRVVF